VGVFGTVIVVVAVIAGVAAILSYIGSGRVYGTIGKGSFALDRDERRAGPGPGTAAARHEQEEEVRQLLQAKSDRRQARGQAPLDVEAELHALLRPTADVDPQLREEVRQLVVARNERRLRRGQAPLDVEAEVERQLRDLGA
jgi:hypothetical protein